ncbi:MAG: ferritin [Candidatus Limnocylindrales bacterium]|jgi:ferritin
MISEPLAKLLIAQVSSELGAHQVYLGISLYFERQSLHRWAKVFRGQSVEEAGHASKIMAFLVDNEIEFDLPGLPVATTHYKSAADAVGVALASEIKVTGQFNVMATAALDAGDHRGFQFLQWFIDEQVEEERTMRALLDLLDSGLNLFQAQELLGEVVEE